MQSTVGSPDPGRLQAARERASTFVLITNLAAEDFDARRLLEEYKGQTVIEQRFHFLKDPAFVDALFVQKPERVAALAMSCCSPVSCSVCWNGAFAKDRRCRRRPGAAHGPRNPAPSPTLSGDPRA
ncbi:transposase (IS4 family protein) [Sulfobacillus acidophilus TPY]|nr:transposase (IS4 family protein) [Sulfobacillus acidophilus TPY]